MLLADSSYPAVDHPVPGTFDKFRSVKMPALPQFDYLFAIGTIFAFLDAWNIGRYIPS